MPERAWLMLAYGESRQYGGNEGYSDSTDHYSYDTNVPNWKQVAAGDLAVIAGRRRRGGAPEVDGFARVRRTTQRDITKRVGRCPVCGHPRFKERTTKLPRWRCDNGHEFDRPRLEDVAVVEVVAWFDDTYQPAADALTPAQLKAAQLHKGDGNSIRPLDAAVIRRAFEWDEAIVAVVDPAGYPDPAEAARINRAAIPLALEHIRARYPDAEVTAQEHANPGFDFLVARANQVVRFVELKSTTGSPGGFFMSEYQRAFSAREASRFSLLVLSELDVVKGTCSPQWFDGAVDDHFELAPMQWRGEL
jgi:Domain of unknown function (DUF3883)